MEPQWQLCMSIGISPWLPNFTALLKGPTRAIFCSINTCFIFQCAETTSFGLGVTQRASYKARYRLRKTEELKREEKTNVRNKNKAANVQKHMEVCGARL